MRRVRLVRAYSQEVSFAMRSAGTLSLCTGRLAAMARRPLSVKRAKATHRKVKLCCSSISADEVQNEQNQANDEQDVNHAGADVKCEEPQQPKND
jgi:hypothetical protein